jgi:hypothetical protein
VLSTSKDGVTWSLPVPIPLDSLASGADHFLPALAVRRGVTGTTLGLSYYGYPQANCTVATCALTAYYSGSYDGGVTWTAPVVLAGPFNISNLASTYYGYMIGDYFSSVYLPSGYVAPLTLAGVAGPSAFHETVASGLTGAPLRPATNVRIVLGAGRATAAQFPRVNQPARYAPRTALHVPHDFL